VPHISGLLISRELDLELTFVPYQGGAPAIAAVMGGQVDATIEMLHSMVSNYQGGMLNILASWTNEPVEGLDFPALGHDLAVSTAFAAIRPLFRICLLRQRHARCRRSNSEEKMDESMADERWDQYCERSVPGSNRL
jgi:tripartite-type tricarboxylate transporter receptor subunit TctC